MRTCICSPLQIPMFQLRISTTEFYNIGTELHKYLLENCVFRILGSNVGVNRNDKVDKKVVGGAEVIKLG